MSQVRRLLILAIVLVGVLGAALRSAGQSPQVPHLPWILKYNAGQNIQPIFHGWSRRPEGGFTMHFGYLNRNYVQRLHVPVGAENRLDPGAEDQGQPTYFYPRFHNFAFSVDVPSDWGERELIWTVTVSGRTDQAVAWLQPEWEIDDPRLGRAREDAPTNEAPSIALPAMGPFSSNTPVSLTANVSDDGLPEGAAPVRDLAVGQETPPTLLPGPDAVQSPVNLPQLPPAPDRTTARRQADPRPEGVSVSWIVWRGPADVTFEPTHSPAEGGQTTTTATFTIPGSYVLRATATDRALTRFAEVTVTVRPQ